MECQNIWAAYVTRALGMIRILVKASGADLPRDTPTLSSFTSGPRSHVPFPAQVG